MFVSYSMCLSRHTGYRFFLKQLFACILLLAGTLTSARAQKTLEIYTDERIELLNVIQYLSDYPVLNQNDSLGYGRDVEHYFGAYRQHPAVRLHRQIYRRMFGFDAPVTYMLHVDLASMQPVIPFTASDRESYGFDKHADTLRLLMQGFKDFYRSTQFHRFFLSQRPFYKRLQDKVQRALNGYNAISVMERHYGVHNAAYKVVLAPLLHNGGYAVDLADKKGHTYYAVVGPDEDSTATEPRYDARLLLSEYILHEFSHNFCNPLIDHYYNQMAPYDCLWEPLQKVMRTQGYGSWKTCLYEHLVRANEIVLNEALFGRQKADSLYGYFIENERWIYLVGLVPIIRNEYLKQRSKYPRLGLIMPLVVAYFEAEARKCR